MIKIRKLTKTYKQKGTKEHVVLRNISLTLPSFGLISIVGRSGCGKSTLLHLIAGIDKTKEGEILFKGKNILKFSSYRLNKYRNESIGIVFQNYQLLEDSTVLENVILPGHIKGGKKEKIVNRAISLLKAVKIQNHLHNEKVKNLSGGEKQRVAICRALINNPDIILADEPTGALDYENSLQIIDILREISRDRLVIMVSHNQQLVNENSDRVIEIEDGKIVDNQIYHLPKKKGNFQDIYMINENKRIPSINWTDKIAFSNLKKRKFKNVLAFISIAFSIFMSINIIGFAFGSVGASQKASLNQIDYGVLQASKEFVSKVPGSNLSLVKSVRPTFEELEENISIYKNLEIGYNQTYFFPYYSEIKSGDKTFIDFMFTPVPNLNKQHIDKSLIVRGNVPAFNTFQEVVVNENCYNKLKKEGFDFNSQSLDVNFVKEIIYYTGDNENPTIKDFYKFEHSFKVIGVVKDFEFLSTPKIYYSYEASIDFLKESKAELLSEYFQKDITWFDYLEMSPSDSDIGSYSLFVYVPYFQDFEIIRDIAKLKIDQIAFSSHALMKEGAFLDLINASTIGISLFLVIAVLGSVLLVGIISFSSYSKDKHDIAIMETLGASKSKILNIYLSENLIVGILGLIIAVVLSLSLNGLISLILETFLGVKGMINIPFANPIFILILILATLSSIFISTVFPIAFTNKLSLKEELKEE